MVESAIPIALSGEREKIAKLQERDREVDALHAHVLDCLRRSSQAEMTQNQTAEAHARFEAANGLERIPDLVERDSLGSGWSASTAGS
jgi:Na+/phosphate symporter